MNSDWYVEMAVVFPIPHVYFGKITNYRGDQPEDTFLVFHRISIQRLLLKPEFYKLSLIQRYWKNVLGIIPEFLDPVIYKSHVLFSVGMLYHSLTHHTLIIYHYNIAGLQLT